MKNIAIITILGLPILLTGCFSSTERVVTVPAPVVVERHVVPETTTTVTETATPYYSAPGTVTTTTRRDTVIENRY